MTRSNTPIIDRDSIIEKAAARIHTHMKAVRDRSDYIVGPASDEAARDAVEAIADGLLAPIDALHQPTPTLEYLPNGVRIPWRACTCGFRTHSACPTAQAVAAIP